MQNIAARSLGFSGIKTGRKKSKLPKKNQNGNFSIGDQVVRFARFALPTPCPPGGITTPAMELLCMRREHGVWGQESYGQRR